MTSEASASQRRWSASKKTRTEYGKERRVALLAELSVRDAIEPLPKDGEVQCVKCRRNIEPGRAQIDHVDGRDWNMEQHPPWVRYARCWREHEAGVRLRVVCISCGSGDAHRHWGRPNARKRNR